MNIVKNENFGFQSFYEFVTDFYETFQFYQDLLNGVNAVR